MPDVANPVYTTMVGSIQQVARANGSRLILHSTDGLVGDELGFLADLKQRYVDGLILCSLQFTDAHAALEFLRHPFQADLCHADSLLWA